jgi:hypothetical protein
MPIGCRVPVLGLSELSRRRITSHSGDRLEQWTRATSARRMSRISSHATQRPTWCYPVTKDC